MAVKTYKKGDTTKLSKNFTVQEFACHGAGCCTTVLIDEQLVEYLQKIRDHFGKPVTITSGYRCETHNKSVNGATSSRHAKGQAADISVQGVKPAEVAKYAESIGILGIGLYETDKDGHFVHIDTRTTKAFWYGQAQASRSTFGGAAASSGSSTSTPTVAAPSTTSVKLPVLKKGHQGEHVKALQLLLVGRGYSCGKSGPDGDFGTNTDTALRKYQTAKKLTVNGTADAATWSSLLGV